MITLLLIFLFSFNNSICVSAANEQTYYAQVMFDDVYFFKNPSSNTENENVYFKLHRTYFVELTDLVNNEFYKANYMGITGYVKKDSVQAVSETPSSPYLSNISFRVYAELSRDLRSEPNTTSVSSTQIAYIPLLNKNLTYIGSIEGECLIEGRTNIWYYCKFKADKDYYGYVYSDFCDEMSTLTENTEQVTYIDNPDFKPVEPTPVSMPTNDKNVGIIVAILSIPAFIFLFMIIKGKNILSKERYKDKEVIDY